MRATAGDGTPDGRAGDRPDVTDASPAVPPPRRFDPVTIGCNLLFALLLLIPAVAILVLVTVAVASVPVLVVLFPITLTVAALALGVLYWRHRRGRG
ncbi:hypothetical protein [uncultured Rhodospira sp.]|uniref:hypothetical protein n=1 Tax=uncultured Rhodospira sp. TaxID=1936189 RepID=UPI00262825B8|nr:hypothetical protein [uncultured Rhodospira sp.]